MAAISFSPPPPALFAVGRIEAQIMDSDRDAETTLDLIAEDLRTGCVDETEGAPFGDFEAVEYRGNPTVLATSNAGITRLGYLAINNVIVFVIIEAEGVGTSPTFAGFDLFLDSTIDLLS